VSKIIPETTAGAATPAQSRSSEKCAQIKNLGFTASRHIKMYGERFEIVSDPFSEGDCIAVHAISEGNSEHHPAIRTLLLPTATLVGLADRFSKAQTLNLAKDS
jgi:hypothetical protein